MDRVRTVDSLPAASGEGRLVDLRDGAIAGGEPDHGVPTAAEYRAALAEIERLNAAVANLNVALDTNRDIAAAVGILMVTEHLEYAQAIDMLRAVSQRHRVKVRALAGYVIKHRTLEGAVAVLEVRHEPLHGARTRRMQPQ
jgi:hypothetical protein